MVVSKFRKDQTLQIDRIQDKKLINCEFNKKIVAGSLKINLFVFKFEKIKLMKPVYVLLVIYLFIFDACKRDVKKEADTGLTNETKLSQSSAVSTPQVVYGKLDDAFIQASSSQKVNHDITDSVWHIFFALSLKDEVPKQNIYAGHWLDLLENGEYKKGIYDKTTDSGRFLYVESTKTLELRSTRDSSSEWTVKVDPDAMVLIGTAKYGNNPWQMKLLRKTGQPSSSEVK